MQLKSFSIKGFGRFNETVVLGPVGDVNVIYGPNNIGKSALLRAMELYFRILGCGEGVSRGQPQILDNPDPELARQIKAAYPEGNPGTIVFRVMWRMSPEDFQKYGVIQEIPCSTLQTEIEVKPSGRTTEVRIVRWEMDGREVATMDRGKDGSIVVYAQQLRRLLADATPFKQDHPVVPFRFIGRRPMGLPQDLRDALFDARMSLKGDERKRWTLFTELVKCLKPEIGVGSWETVFDRATGKADLAFLRDEVPVPVDAQGDGVQRWLTLIAELCVAREPYVAMEEPEWRMSPDLQRRFLEMAARVVERRIVAHVFLATHSPALASGAHSFEMHLVDSNPHCENRPWVVAGAPPPSAVSNGAAGHGAGADLGNLIGLVEDLAELDLDSLAEEPVPA